MKFEMKMSDILFYFFAGWQGVMLSILKVNAIEHFGKFLLLVIPGLVLVAAMKSFARKGN